MDNFATIESIVMHWFGYLNHIETFYDDRYREKGEQICEIITLLETRPDIFDAKDVADFRTLYEQNKASAQQYDFTSNAQYQQFIKDLNNTKILLDKKQARIAFISNIVDGDNTVSDDIRQLFFNRQLAWEEKYRSIIQSLFTHYAKFVQTLPPLYINSILLQLHLNILHLVLFRHLLLLLRHQVHYCRFPC